MAPSWLAMLTLARVGMIAAAPTLALQEDDSFSACLPLTVHSGAFYTTPLGVGTPPQILDVVTDSGSYALLMDSDYCSSEGCKIHKQFDPKLSNSSINPAPGGGFSAVDTAYGQGSVTAVRWQETVQLGERVMPEVDLLLMTSSELDGWDTSDPFDGIMGMGRRESTTANQKALLSSLGVDTFTMCLGDIAGGGRLEMGEGGELSEATLGEFAVASTTGVNAWAAPMNGVGVGNTTIDLPTVCSDSIARYGDCTTIVDSGTTLLVFPKPMHDALHAALDEACADCVAQLLKMDRCDAELLSRLPTVEISLGGVQLSLEPRVYMAPVEIDAKGEIDFSGIKGPTEYAVPDAKPSGADWSAPANATVASAAATVGAPSPSKVGEQQAVGCVPLFSSLDELPTQIGPIVILGMPLFRQYAIRFARGTGTVSFAALAIEQQQALCNGCPAAIHNSHNSDRDVTGPAKGRRRGKQQDANSDVSVPSNVLLPEELPGSNNSAIRHGSIRFPSWAVASPDGSSALSALDGELLAARARRVR